MEVTDVCCIVQCLFNNFKLELVQLYTSNIDVIDEKLMKNNLSIAIQAGGKSQRMEKNKAYLEFSGIPLIKRIIQRVSEIADDIFVVCNNPPEVETNGIYWVTDRIKGKGPIGGLFTAMMQAKNEYVAVIACDMPFVNAELIQASLEVLIENKTDVVIPKLINGFEPLHAVYRRDACRDPIKNAIENDQRKLVSWLSVVAVTELDQQFCDRFDPERLAFMNINTNQDYEHAKLIACQLAKQKNPTSF